MIGRIRTSFTMSEAEVDREIKAWQNGCICHTCRILNGKPEPKKKDINITFEDF